MKGYELCVSKVPLFQNLDAEALEHVFSKVHATKVHKGDYLFMAGDDVHTLFVIHSGKVRIFRLTAEGDEQLIRILSHSDFTGELTLFNASEHANTYAEALEDSDVCTIHQAAIHELITDYPEISIKMIEGLAERLNQSETMTTQIALMSSKERLLEYIQLETKAGLLKLSMTKKNLATYLSMQPETLNRTFKQLEQEGVLDKINHNTYKVKKN
ncbi:Crp/Fnr family transcriptional regulator [Staphylococcus simulans]